MSRYLEWLSRVVPPRPGAVRVLAANGTSQVANLATDIYQFTQGGANQSYGTALLRIQNQDSANSIFVLFSSLSNAVANSAASSGNTVPSVIPPAQDREFEINPNVDAYMAYQCPNGSSNTATVRYWIVSWPQSSIQFGA